MAVVNLGKKKEEEEASGEIRSEERKCPHSEKCRSVYEMVINLCISLLLRLPHATLTDTAPSQLISQSRLDSV